MPIMHIRPKNAHYAFINAKCAFFKKVCIFACYCVYGVARISCIRSISRSERTTQINLIAVICIKSKNTPLVTIQKTTNKQTNKCESQQIWFNTFYGNKCAAFSCSCNN